MSAARFTLVVCATADGFIARAPGHSPAEWASPEEQAVFLAAVDAADWAVMGRGTHEAAPRPDRRRIVLSGSASHPEWRAPGQFWLDPTGRAPSDLPGLVGGVRPLREGLILGGTRAHDWFHAHRAVDAVELTVEPVSFGAGLPVFSDQRAREAVEAFLEKGYRVRAERRLNSGGTRLVSLGPRG
ncbi:hypothetical protein [Rubrimonas cliftonensis]|uniref:Dihydrofolate reductase n=1 Tax=Rubrimonas cliftonensis TaxID=89524 RepID=A0A1H3YH00_9RHOB|nr:hypothetical protein [Rubrimonas cliftonensis]SEA10816.1 Dihydrofolate reductase [Rubrimonas cliftonensis]